MGGGFFFDPFAADLNINFVVQESMYSALI